MTDDVVERGAVSADMYEVFMRELVGADRVVIETKNALGEMDAHYLHAPTLRAAMAPREVTGWQPIETAPKDGQTILVCLPRMMNLIVRSRWNTVHRHWLNDYEGEGGVSRAAFYHEGDLWQPMPLPPAPEDKP